MSAPHRSTPEHWAAVEAYAQQVSSTNDCLLELRARVKALEQRCEAQSMQLSDLQGRHHRLTLQVGHLEHELVRDDDDKPQQHCLEAMDPPEANPKPTPDSLVNRVMDAIAFEHEITPEPRYEARAAIREVNAWLRERAGGTRASWLLDNEIEQ